MSSRTVTRASLGDAVYQKIGLSRAESALFVEQFFERIATCLERGETVKISLFGSFMVRFKKERTGRNPKTGEEVPITSRRVLVFKPSNTLKCRVNEEGEGKVKCMRTI